MLNKSGKNGHLCLVSHLRVNAFIFSPLSMMLLVASGKASPHASCSGPLGIPLPSMPGPKTLCGVGACRGPAPVDPGKSMGGRRWRGKTCLFINVRLY